LKRSYGSSKVFKGLEERKKSLGTNWSVEAIIEFLQKIPEKLNGYSRMSALIDVEKRQNHRK